MLKSTGFEFSVGIGGFVIGLGQIFFFFSLLPPGHTCCVSQTNLDFFSKIGPEVQACTCTSVNCSVNYFVTD